MKVLVTGVSGQLGSEVMLEAARRGYTVFGSARRQSLDIFLSVNRLKPDNMDCHLCQFDLTDELFVRTAIEMIRPDAIVHCAAWTAVDAAEAVENRNAVLSLNVLATRYLAESARDIGAKMLYLSTDYVFSGQGCEPWEPDEKGFHPLNYYGKSKLAGEDEISKILDRFFIVRTSWLFGKNGKNFVQAIMEAGRCNTAVSVVNDQIGTPTYAVDLARLLIDIIETEKYGYYHATNEGGFISWYDFTREIFRQAKLTTTILPVSTREYGLNTATRPNNSRLDKSKLIKEGFEPLPDWRDALSRYLIELGDLAKWDK